MSLKIINNHLRWFAPLVLIALPHHSNALSSGDKTAYIHAFKHADEGNWSLARKHVRRVQELLPTKALQWMRITDRRTKVSFHEITAFIKANPHWPKQKILRRRAEESITDRTPKSEILNWFSNSPPVTGRGAYHYIRLLLKEKKITTATKFARHAWINIHMGYAIEKQFRKDFRKLIQADDHIARLERLLWNRRILTARRQLRRMSHDYQWLGLARIALMRREPGVDHAVSKVPNRLLDNAGLVYERIRWRRKNKLYDSAIELLHRARKPLVKHKRWWTERRILTRRLLRNGKPEEAYLLVTKHHQLNGLGLAEAEWLAGWIALRSLNRYVDAFVHFRKLFNSVSYPVSKARAAYWAGRAAAASGKTRIAFDWYIVAASHVTTFYGQLAAANLPLEFRPRLPKEPMADDQTATSFAHLELVRLIKMLGDIDQTDEIDPFIQKLASNTNSAPEWTLIANLARDVKRKDLAIYIAKKALNQGVILSYLGYPKLDHTLNSAPDPAFINAVVRQESAFNSKAISHAGARGLMQLMPRTAQKIAKQMKISYSRKKLLQNPKYNVRIGLAYLLQLLKEYNGSPILTLAAYNAGPARVKRWLRAFGNPNRSSEHAIDWIECIPFYETRNYIQRVLENFTVYSNHGKDHRLSISASERIKLRETSVIP